MAKVEKAMEETDDRHAFFYFFTAVIVIMFLGAGWYIVSALSEQGLLPISYWGVYTIAIGLAVLGLSEFKMFYPDRYGFSAAGILLAVFGYVYAVIIAPYEIPQLARGVLFMVLGGSLGGLVYYLNSFGWDTIKGSRKRYIILCVLLALFLVAWAFAEHYIYYI